MALVPLAAVAGVVRRMGVGPGWRTQVPGFDEEELNYFVRNAESGGDLEVAHP